MAVEIEQSTASIIAYILQHIPHDWRPIYRDLPESFQPPIVYFQVPETEWEPHTLRDYKRVFVMYVLFFGQTLRAAHAAAMEADAAIKVMRGFVPRLAPDGTSTDYLVHTRMSEQRTRVIDEDHATVQLSLTWWEPVRYWEREAQKMMHFDMNMYRKNAD